MVNWARWLTSRPPATLLPSGVHWTCRVPSACSKTQVPWRPTGLVCSRPSSGRDGWCWQTGKGGFPGPGRSALPTGQKGRTPSRPTLHFQWVKRGWVAFVEKNTPLGICLLVFPPTMTAELLLVLYLPRLQQGQQAPLLAVHGDVIVLSDGLSVTSAHMWISQDVTAATTWSPWHPRPRKTHRGEKASAISYHSLECPGLGIQS